MWKVDNGKGMWAWVFPNFERKEFACKCGCGFDDIDRLVVVVLQDFRYFINKGLSPEEEHKIIITSGCRCKSHNAAIGGVPNSQHVLGKAVDFAVPFLSSQEIMIQLMQSPGIRQCIGHMEAAGGSAYAVHIDVRKPETFTRRRWERVGGNTVQII